jgi:hypothetical protein
MDGALVGTGSHNPSMVLVETGARNETQVFWSFWNSLRMPYLLVLSFNQWWAGISNCVTPHGEQDGPYCSFNRGSQKMEKLALMYNQGIKILKTHKSTAYKTAGFSFCLSWKSQVLWGFKKTLELAIPDQHFFGENLPKCKKKNGNVKAFLKSGV